MPLLLSVPLKVFCYKKTKETSSSTKPLKVQRCRIYCGNIYIMYKHIAVMYLFLGKPDFRLALLEVSLREYTSKEEGKHRVLPPFKSRINQKSSLWICSSAPALWLAGIKLAVRRSKPKMEIEISGVGESPLVLSQLGSSWGSVLEHLFGMQKVVNSIPDISSTVPAKLS